MMQLKGQVKRARSHSSPYLNTSKGGLQQSDSSTSVGGGEAEHMLPSEVVTDRDEDLPALSTKEPGAEDLHLSRSYSYDHDHLHGREGLPTPRDAALPMTSSAGDRLMQKLNCFWADSDETAEKLRHCFLIFDKDGDGCIGADELGSVMNNLGETQPRAVPRLPSCQTHPPLMHGEERACVCVVCVGVCLLVGVDESAAAAHRRERDRCRDQPDDGGGRRGQLWRDHLRRGEFSSSREQPGGAAAKVATPIASH